MQVIAVDFGGSHATIALLRDRCILSSTKLPMDSRKPLGPALSAVRDAIFTLIAELGSTLGDFSGLAVGFCGIVDSTNGRVLGTNGKYDDAPEIDFGGWCASEFEMPFALENDARMALLGEWYGGAAQGKNDVVMITLGTGIGGATMMNGKLLRNRSIVAGGIGGHIPVAYRGRPCTCGSIGCMEAEASGWALPIMVQEWPGFRESRLAKHEINFESLFELANFGDRVAIEVRERCLQVWASGTVGLIHAYGPETVVFGGGVMGSSDAILPYIQKHVDKHAWMPIGFVSIAKAELGEDAALLGAIPMLTT